ncbi:hypothetical protein C8T65DRAFT_725428 [Cerioporus squamosus]|nr:hypothetical protein C8T65DRAFT_725428 [Cerioporus squamosus]
MAGCLSDADGIPRVSISITVLEPQTHAPASSSKHGSAVNGTSAPFVPSAMMLGYSILRKDHAWHLCLSMDFCRSREPSYVSRTTVRCSCTSPKPELEHLGSVFATQSLRVPLVRDSFAASVQPQVSYVATPLTIKSGHEDTRQIRVLKLVCIARGRVCHNLTFWPSRRAVPFPKAKVCAPSILEALTVEARSLGVRSPRASCIAMHVKGKNMQGQCLQGRLRTQSVTLLALGRSSARTCNDERALLTLLSVLVPCYAVYLLSDRLADNDHRPPRGIWQGVALVDRSCLQTHHPDPARRRGPTRIHTPLRPIRFILDHFEGTGIRHIVAGPVVRPAVVVGVPRNVHASDRIHRRMKSERDPAASASVYLDIWRIGGGVLVEQLSERRDVKGASPRA